MFIKKVLHIKIALLSNILQAIPEVDIYIYIKNNLSEFYSGRPVYRECQPFR